jgi:hypothetical protein
MPVSSAYSSVRYRHMLPRIEIVPRLCLSTFGFHVVINAQSSRFFKLPEKEKDVKKAGEGKRGRRRRKREGAREKGAGEGEEDNKKKQEKGKKTRKGREGWGTEE